LVLRNNADDICRFVTFEDLGEDTLEILEDSNNLITPIMNYIREAKGIQQGPSMLIVQGTR